MKWIIFSALTFAATVCRAETTAATFPSAASDDSSIGTTAWSNPTFIENIDANSSSNTVTASGSSPSHYLVGSGFTFSGMNSNATVQGIQVHWDKHVPIPDASGTRMDYSVIIVVGSSTSTDKSVGAAWTNTLDYGGISDTWGLSNLHGSDLSTLQVKIAGINDSTPSTAVIAVSYVTVTITYTNPNSGGGFNLASFY